MIYFDFKEIYDKEYTKRLVNHSFYSFLDSKDWSLEYFINEVLTKEEDFSIVHPSYLNRDNSNYFVRVSSLGLFIKGDFVLSESEGYFKVKDFILTEATKYKDYELDYHFKIGVYNDNRKLHSDMTLIKRIIKETSDHGDFKVADFVSKWNEYLEFEKKLFKDRIGFYHSDNYEVREIYQVKRTFENLDKYKDDIYYDDGNNYLYLEIYASEGNKYYIVEFDVTIKKDEYNKLLAFVNEDIEIANEKDALEDNKLVTKKELEFEFKTTKLGTILLHPFVVSESEDKVTYRFSKFYNDEDSYYFNFNQIREYIVNNYGDRPLLVNILSGDISLYKRGKDALERVKRGDLYNPYLINYLFNIHEFESHLDKINKEDINWNNENLDEYQKEAIYRSINSNSIFLIQGPPGTGKTQTISELVYQFNKMGKRVLLSSQTHVAIDNVLERLPNELGILPIRLVNSERKGKVDSLFLPNNVTDNLYYKMKSKYEEKLSDFDLQKDKLNKMYQEYEEIASLYSKNKEKRDNYVSLRESVDELNKRIIETESLVIDSESKMKYLEKDNAFLMALMNKQDYKGNYSSSLLLENLTGARSFISKYELDSYYKEGMSLLTFISLVKHGDKQNDVTFQFDLDNLLKNNEKLFKERLGDNKKEMVELSSSLSDISKKLESYKEEKREKETTIKKEFNHFYKSFEKMDDYYYKMFNKVMFTSKIPTLEENKLKSILSYLDKRKEEVNAEREKYNDYEDIYKSVVNYIDDDLISNDKKHYTKYLTANNVNVYALTCNATSRYLKNNNSYLKEYDIQDIDLNNIDFDVVIIDEVSKASDIELLIPVLYGKTIILVGDHRQLPPLFKYKDDAVANNLISEEKFNLFEEMVETSLFKKLFNEAKENKYMLVKQYRSHKQIMDIVNLFYDDKLIMGNNEEQNNLKEHYLEIENHDRNLISKNVHTYWLNSYYDKNYNVCYEEKERFGGKVSSSFYNSNEANITLSLLKLIDEGYENNKDKALSVGVISLYKDQVKLLRKEVGKMNFKNILFSKGKVSTVDEFQGKEEDIIIVNLVRNNPSKKASEFVKKFERINVALSRARKLLVIVGAKEFFTNLDVELEKLDDQSLKIKKKLYKDIYDRTICKIDNPFTSYLSELGEDSL